MIRCDMEGMPKIVQEVTYNFGGFWFIFTLFDGEKAKIDAGYVQRMCITTKEPTNKQFAQAEAIYLGFRERGI